MYAKAFPFLQILVTRPKLGFSPHIYSDCYNRHNIYYEFSWLLQDLKSLAFQSRMHKEGKYRRGRQKVLSWTSGRQAHLCSRSVVYYSFSVSLSLFFLAHCHMGASRYNVPLARFDACPGWQYIWHMNIYEILSLADARANMLVQVRMIHDAPRSIWERTTYLHKRHSAIIMREF